jgi:hypothetical protein
MYVLCDGISIGIPGESVPIEREFAESIRASELLSLAGVLGLPGINQALNDAPLPQGPLLTDALPTPSINLSRFAADGDPGQFLRYWERGTIERWIDEQTGFARQGEPLE